MPADCAGGEDSVGWCLRVGVGEVEVYGRG